MLNVNIQAVNILHNLQLFMSFQDIFPVEIRLELCYIMFKENTTCNPEVHVKAM